MTPRGGAGKGQGRKPRPTKQRLDVKVEKWAKDHLLSAKSASAEIERLLLNDMTTDEKYRAAHSRIGELAFSEEDQEFVFLDRLNWDEHINWLLIASRDEIRKWIDAGK